MAWKYFYPVFFCAACAALSLLSVKVWECSPDGWFLEDAAASCAPRPFKSLSGRRIQSFVSLFALYALSLSKGPPEAFTGSCFLPLLLFALVQLFLSDSFYQILQDQWTLIIFAAGIISFALSFAASFLPRGACFKSLQSPGCTACIISKPFSALLVLAAWVLSAFIAAAADSDPPFGMGDAKLLAAWALLAGPEGLVSAMITASLLSGLWAFCTLFSHEKRDRIAFGPFICIGIMCYLLSTSYI